MPEQNPYNIAIAELSNRRAALLEEIKGIEAVLQSLTQMSGSALSPTNNAVKAMSTGKYSNISLHWACLWILAEDQTGGLSTSQIAQILLEGGRQSNAYSFPSTVSAVLSGMKTKSQEIEQIGNEWRITPNGKLHWEVVEKRAKQLAL